MTNRRAIDGWTLVHIASGALAGAYGMSRKRAYGVALVYEVVEQMAERTEAGQRLFGTSSPESLQNAAMDMVVFAAGYELARRYR